MDAIAGIQARIASIQSQFDATTIPTPDSSASSSASPTSSTTPTSAATAVTNANFADMLAALQVTDDTGTDGTDGTDGSSSTGSTDSLSSLESLVNGSNGTGSSDALGSLESLINGSSSTGTSTGSTDALSSLESLISGTNGASSVGSTGSLTAAGGSNFVNTALAEAGKQYVFGATDSPANANPTSFDCSELVQWSAARNGVALPRTAGQQYATLAANGDAVSVQQALNTPGALLFSFSSPPKVGGAEPSHAHVAISLGDGRTIEARGKAYGVGIFQAGNRFNYAASVPGLS